MLLFVSRGSLFFLDYLNTLFGLLWELVPVTYVKVHEVEHANYKVAKGHAVVNSVYIILYAYGYEYSRDLQYPRSDETKNQNYFGAAHRD